MKPYFYYFLSFFAFFLIFSKNIYAQTITGKINAIGNVPIALANVLIKEGENIAQFVIARNGQYSITVAESYPKIIIEIQAQGYLPEIQTIENPQKDKTYTKDFTLQINNDQNLEEVTIEAPKRAIEEKGDSTFYNVDAFKQVGDRKIIDVIKKMPGMNVNDKTGEIKYKGKSIETVMLDGDNLFGHNYSIGTKNINIDMVEQVQAIENYVANPLLKDLEGGDKVSLNLKLKKGIDLSGSATIGAGVNAEDTFMRNAGANVLGISKRYKSFGILDHNNIGVNQSPYDYFGNNMSVESLKEKEYKAQKLLPEMIFSTSFDDQRANINNAWFGNYNIVFKINPRLRAKVNVYYLQDNIFSNQITQNQIKFGNQDFNTSDNRTIYKNPSYMRGDTELKYNTSKTSLLEYNISLSHETINTQNTTLQNETTNFDTQLQSNNLNLKQKAVFTQRLKNTKALQIEINHTTNQIPQQLYINPAVLNQNTQYDLQKTQSTKNYLEIKNTLLGNHKGKKYAITAGFIWDNNPINSNLLSINNNIETNIAKNNLKYTKKSLYAQSGYNINAGNWRFSTTLRIEGLTQTLRNYEKDSISQSQNLIFLPTLNIRYKINELNFLSANASYTQSPNAENYLFENSILTNNRSITQNIPNLRLQSTYNYGLRYSHRDNLTQFFAGLGASYQQKEGNFFSNFELTPTITRTTYFFLPQNADNLNFDGMMDGYVPFLDAFAKINLNYSISNYKNIINNSEIRNNETQNLGGQFELNTAFMGNINFKNLFTFNHAQSKNQNNTFTNTSLSYIFKIVSQPFKDWSFIPKSEYYVPNTDKQAQDYLFIDVELNYRPEKSRYTFGLIGNNLLNRNTFSQVETSDFGVTRFDSRLMARYFMVLIGINF